MLAPELVPTDFVFSAIDPDTPTMRTAVSAQLLAFFEDSVEFATDVQSDSYRGAIQNTYDIEGATSLVSFALTSPTGNISVDIGEIATLGTVSFP